MFLSLYLQEMTKSGSGCVWYFITVINDSVIGLTVCYVIFRIIDDLAVKFEIEVLKSGVYTDKSVPVDYSEDFDPDD